MPFCNSVHDVGNPAVEPPLPSRRVWLDIALIAFVCQLILAVGAYAVASYRELPFSWVERVPIAIMGFAYGLAFLFAVYVAASYLRSNLCYGRKYSYLTAFFLTCTLVIVAKLFLGLLDSGKVDSQYLAYIAVAATISAVLAGIGKLSGMMRR